MTIPDARLRDTAGPRDTTRLRDTARPRDAARPPDNAWPLDNAWPRRIAVPAAVAGGALAVFAFPGTNWWWLAPISVALLIGAARGRRARRGALLGFGYGLAFLVPLLHWTGIQVGWLPWLALATMEAVFPAVAGAGFCLTQRLPHPGLRVLGSAAVWVGAEAAQARVPFGGFAWSRLAFSQSTSPLAGFAALAGTPAVTFAVVVIAALLVEVIRPRPRTLRGALVPAALAALVPLVGLAVPTPTDAQAGSLDVAGIQGNVPRMGLEFNAERRAVLDNHAALTVQLADRIDAGRARPDLVVWPENASDIDPYTNPDAYRVIDDAVAAVDTTTILGTLVAQPNGRLRNSVLQWEPGRGPLAHYDKRAPVPFAEYVPYRSFFRAITPIVDQAGDFEAGDRVGLLTVTARDGRQVPVGVLICFEVVNDRLVRDVTVAGAQIIVVPTNNATFGFTDESRQQLAISRLRAIETGRSVLQVSTVGVSGFILPDGTLVDESSLFTATTLTGRLPLRTSPTLATRLGSTPEWLLAAAGLLAASAGARRATQTRSRRPEREEPAPMSRTPSTPRRSVWLLVAVLALPVIEITTLILVGRALGFWPTLAAIIAVTVLGGLLLTREWPRTWRSLRDALAIGGRTVEGVTVRGAARDPGVELLDGALVLIGAVLLVLPGFFTDLLAVICLLPATRPVPRRLLAGLIRRRTERFTVRLRGAAVGPVRSEVVDGGAGGRPAAARIIEPPR